MTDVVLVALISAGFAFLTAVITHYLTSRSANKSADRAERREALQWDRSEKLRLEEVARKDSQDALVWQRGEAQRVRDAQQVHLRDLWEAVTEARRRLWDFQLSGEKHMPSSDRSVAHAAARAHLVAVVALPSLRKVTTEFYAQAVGMELKMQGEDWEVHVDKWSKSIADLENEISSLAKKIHS